MEPLSCTSSRAVINLHHTALLGLRLPSRKHCEACILPSFTQISDFLTAVVVEGLRLLRQGSASLPRVQERQGRVSLDRISHTLKSR